MKTAVSIPDEIFERAERFAKREGRTRSDVVSAALAEYIVRHSPDEVTKSMNDALDAIDEKDDGFLREAQRRALKRVEW